LVVGAAVGGPTACRQEVRGGGLGREKVTLSTETYLRRPGRSEKLLYVIGRISEGEGSRVLCVTSASGAETLPVFSHREAARRYLRATPPRLNFLVSESEAGAILAWPPGGIEEITLDPSPETLCGECVTEPLAEVI